MKFIHEGPEQAAKAVAKLLTDKIKTRKPVIWLVCGGSNIPTQVAVMKQLRETAADSLGSLLILPMDERYGVAGHADSNYKQMQDAGFEPGAAMWVDVLANNTPLQETVEYYSGLVQAAFSAADSIVGTFGLGTDGHTAGVLPGSPAVTDTVSTVVGYDSPPFVRLTIAPEELAKTSTAYLLAYGNSKKEPLKRLKANKEPFEKLPAKLLYELPEAYVYNDQLEGEV